jgi:uracil-DNA glycosylase family 4
VQDDLESIAVEVRRCRRCPLAESRTHAVPGEGPTLARCMLIGESPGAEEDRLGRPFVGRSGRFLDRVLKDVNLDRDELFITGSVKCHPPGNRDPRAWELRQCRSYLDRQIKVVSPDVLVLLGRIAVRGFLGESKIEAVRGRVSEVGGRTILPTYHPSAAMRFPGKRAPFREDMRTLPRLLAGAL